MPEKIIFRETSPLLPETFLGVAGLSSDEYFSKVAHLKEELGSSQRPEAQGRGVCKRRPGAEMSQCRSQVRKFGTQSRHLGGKERFPLRPASCAN